MTITIYHNPACGTSRNVLALIRNSGEEPQIVEYLKTPPTRDELANLIRRMGITPRDLLRRKGTSYDARGLDDPKFTDDELIALMVQDPLLINRPIVVTPLGVKLGRPSEAVLDILPNPQQGIGFKGEPPLPRDIYPEILAGNVKSWDDPRIQAANPNLRFPHRGIVVAARLDSSGTTFGLSRHLAEINRNWRDNGLGVGKLIAWRGAMLARGNEGVAQLIKISDGVIGYVEFGFAARLGLPMAALENKAGKFVAPTDAAGRATMAAAGDDVPDDLRSYLADPEGDQAYPIITLSWVALHERYRNPVKGAALKEFVGWGLTDGQAFSSTLGYVPLPASLSGRSQQALSRE